jgi:hypothetical protein
MPGFFGFHGQKLLDGLGCPLGPGFQVPAHQVQGQDGSGHFNKGGDGEEKAQQAQ